MALKLVKTLGLAGLMAIAATAFHPEPTLAQSDRFFCGTAKIGGRKVPATYAFTPGQGNVPIILWGRNDFRGSVSPRERCYTVARRFQTYYENRTLKYIRTGEIGGYPVICVANVRGGTCPKNQVLITLSRNSDPNSILSQLLDVRSRSTGRTVYLSGEGQVFYEDGEAYIDIEQLLELAPSADSEEIE